MGRRGERGLAEIDRRKREGDENKTRRYDKIRWERSTSEYSNIS
jgi:hypothetical protein